MHRDDWEIDNERVEYLRSHRDTNSQLDRAHLCDAAVIACRHAACMGSKWRADCAPPLIASVALPDSGRS
jgi:hypothetical protein